MPFPFQAILISGATGYLLTGILFMLLRLMPRTEPGAAWWALSSLAGGIGYLALLSLAMTGDPERGEVVYNALFIVFAAALYLGGRSFLRLTLPVRFILFSGAALLAWLIAIVNLSPHFLAEAIPVALFCGILNLHLAWLWSRTAMHKSSIDYVIIGLLAVSGLHWLDYPLLRPVEWFAPIGFSLCAITASVLNASLAAMLIRQFRTRMEASEQAAINQAHLDPLTGLGNRLALDAQFEQVLAMSEREGKRLAMLYIDLDNFKPVNDTHGHEVGDGLLVDVAKRLRTSFRDGDIISRIGGDEFVVILSGVSQGKKGEEDVRNAASKALASIVEPAVIQGQTCTISASVGIGFTPDHGTTLKSLMQATDKAMYGAKSQGKKAIAFADPC